MADMTISAEVVVKGRRVACRYKWLDPCKKSGAKHHRDFMKEGTPYIAIRGWSSSGQIVLAVCEYHAQDLFDQLTKAKKDLTRVCEPFQFWPLQFPGEWPAHTFGF